MKLRRAIIAVAIIHSCQLGFAQDISNHVLLESGLPLTNITMIGKPVPSGDLIGSAMLFDTISYASVYLANDTKVESGVNIDLIRGILYFTHAQSYYSIPIQKLDSMFVGKVKYIVESIGNNYTVLEELVSGKYALYIQNQIVVKEPDYNVALDLGSRDTKIIQKISYLIKYKNHYYNSRSDRADFLKETDKNQILAFKKENNLTWREQEDLEVLVKFCNAEI